MGKKHICGYYKGFRVVQEGEMIGNNWYGVFYPCEKKGNRYYRIKDVEFKTWKELKEYINKRISN